MHDLLSAQVIVSVNGILVMMDEVLWVLLDKPNKVLKNFFVSLQVTVAAAENGPETIFSPR
ncbi:MAG: hypothetical protein K0B01_14070 [Syntrophobacterales bacterium]|nr:hypothetical protein [Syntrophobacterales bacterium]